jgi:hypothetical protein
MDKGKSEIAIFIILTTFVILLLILLLVNLLLSGRNKRLRFKNDLAEMKTQLEMELAKTRVEVAESTLNDVARDLHDDVGQQISFSIIQLNNLLQVAELSTNKTFAEAKESMHEALQSVRSISKVLSQDYISSFGINNAIEQLFSGLKRKRIIQTTLDFSKDIHFKSASNEIFAFRIIQECISNTIKHAEADHLSLSIHEEDKNIIVTYSDNGKGVNFEMINSDFKKFSMGFSNLIKRAELMKGKIDFLPAENGGLKTVLVFPNI